MYSQWVKFEQYIEMINCNFFENVSLYHNPLWLRILIKTFDAQCKVIVTYSGDNKVLSATPYLLIKKVIFNLYGSPIKGLYTEFLGPLLIKGIDLKTLLLIIESQHKLIIKKADYIELRNSNLNHEAIQKSLHSLGYFCSNHPSNNIDLSVGLDALWGGFKSQARNKIRKAEKSGVSVHMIKATPDWIDIYYSMLSDTFRRQKSKPFHPISFYKGLLDLSETENIFFISAKIENEYIAHAIFLIDNNRMLYLSGTADKKGMKFAANSLIQWYAMSQAIVKGCEKYDMGGLGVDSIDKFKKSFGGIVISEKRWVYRSRIFSIIEPIALWAVKRGFLGLGSK